MPRLLTTARPSWWKTAFTALSISLLPLINSCRTTETVEPESAAASKTGVTVIGSVHRTRGEGQGALAGTRVVIKGATTGTLTDSNGTFRLENVPPGSTLVFSSEGFGSKEFTVGPAGKGSMNTVIYDVQLTPKLGNGEEPTPSRLSVPAGTVFMVVEEMPTFIGGLEGLGKYLGENIVYPKEAAANKVTGTVFVSFVVNADGSISDAQVLKGVGSGCNEEALRVVQNMPSWQPGKQSGQPVAVRYSLPIRFML